MEHLHGQAAKQQPQIVIAQRRRRMSKKRITWRDIARNRNRHGGAYGVIVSDNRRIELVSDLKIDHRSDGCRSPHRRQSQRDPDIFCNRPQLRTTNILRQQQNAGGEHTEIEHPEPRLHKSCQQIRKHRTDGDGEWDRENQAQNWTTLPELEKVKRPSRDVPWGEHEWEKSGACLKRPQRVDHGEISHGIRVNSECVLSGLG